MEILHVVSGMDAKSGGVTQAVRTIALGLSDAGFKNEIVCFGSQFSETHNGLIMHLKGDAKTPWQYGKNLKPWLENNLKRFDIVIVHGLWQYHSFIIYEQWKKINSDPPSIYVMPHGMLDPYFQRAKDRKIKAIRNWAYWKLIEKHLINNAKGVLFTCETEMILARETFRPYRPQKELIVGLGVEKPPMYSKCMEEEFRKKRNINYTKPYWLYLSRIHPKKGIDILIKSYLALLEIDKNIPELVIVGPGLETDFGQNMKALAGFIDNVQFVGTLSGDAKWGAFYGCEAFILPSHQENFGIAVVEAMACGKPVLISDQVNIWREVESERAGIIAPATEDGVKNQLLRWLSQSPTENAMMGIRAKNAFHKHFSVQEATKKMVEAIGVA